MSWFYNSHSGDLANESGAAALPFQLLLHAGIGWHELNISGSATFEQAAAEALKEVPGGATPTGNIAQAAGQLGAGAVSAAASSVVNDTLKPLFQANIWLRGGEILVGIILLAIGVNALFKGKPLQAVTGAVGTAAKVVPV